MNTPSSLEAEIAQLLVETLNLELKAEEIEPESPLFGDGLGLDSIDTLETALAICDKYGFQLRSDDPDNARIFSSLRTLTAHVNRNRTR
jgi:acyl carrier protein